MRRPCLLVAFGLAVALGACEPPVETEFEQPPPVEAIPFVPAEALEPQRPSSEDHAPTDDEVAYNLGRWLERMDLGGDEWIAPLGLGQGEFVLRDALDRLPQPSEPRPYDRGPGAWPQPIERFKPVERSIVTEDLLDLGGTRARVRLTYRAERPSNSGEQTIELLTREGRVVQAYGPFEVSYTSNNLWEWGGSDPFLDLDGDGVDDFGIVTSRYRTHVVQVWLSGGDDRHEPVTYELGEATLAYELGEATLEAGVLVERTGPFDSYTGHDWIVRVHDFAESDPLRYRRRYGVAPDTLSGEGQPLLYRYDDASALHQALYFDHVPLAPDRYLLPRDLPVLDRPRPDMYSYYAPDGFEAFVAEVYAMRTKAVASRLAEFSGVFDSPPGYRRRPAISDEILQQVPTPHARARYAISVLGW